MKSLVRGCAYALGCCWLLSGLASPQARAGERCGYSAVAGAVAQIDGGVPLLFRSAPLPRQERARLSNHRAHLLRRARLEEPSCPATRAYLQAILARLLRGSGLEGFAGSAPALQLIVQCGRGPRLPIARASAGKILLVPAALPRLAASEDAIAAVLAHELAHLTLRHAERSIHHAVETGERVSRAVKGDHEREADTTGLKILANAGYDPRAAVDHLQAVEALARATHAARTGEASQPRRRRSVHDPAEARMGRLEQQIQACSYGARAPRAAVPSTVLRELTAQPAAWSSTDNSPAVRRASTKAPEKPARR